MSLCNVTSDVNRIWNHTSCWFESPTSELCFLTLFLLLGKVPCRLLIAIMIFTCICVNYMMRVNLSVNLVAMVPIANHTNSESQITLNWTAYERAQILSGYFWGYIFGSVAGGPVTEILGPRILVSLAVLISSALTHLSPVAAKYSYLALLVVRVIIGLVSGLIFPACHVLISKWAVGAEKGRFLGALIGGTIGTFFAWILCGLVIEPFGWEWGFHLFGILGILWVIVCWFLVYDTPEKHPLISPSESQYIQKGLSNMSSKKAIPPYFKIFTTIPFWSMSIMNFGTGWGIYFVITAAPNYLASVLGYNTSSTSILSALIYLARSSCALGFGYIGDIALKRNALSVKMLRSVASIVSHVAPGCIVLFMAIPGHDPIFYVVLIVIAMSLNGAVTISSLANAHDLTKHYVGTLTGITGMLTTVAGALTPFVTAYFTKDDETSQTLWQPVFYTGGLVYIITGVQFIIFGSTNRQYWDTLPGTDLKKENTIDHTEAIQ